jgi:hypothetical protein
MFNHALTRCFAIGCRGVTNCVTTTSDSQRHWRMVRGILSGLWSGHRPSCATRRGGDRICPNVAADTTWASPSPLRTLSWRHSRLAVVDRAITPNRLSRRDSSAHGSSTCAPARQSCMCRRMRCRDLGCQKHEPACTADSGSSISRAGLRPAAAPRVLATLRAAARRMAKIMSCASCQAIYVTSLTINCSRAHRELKRGIL